MGAPVMPVIAYGLANAGHVRVGVYTLVMRPLKKIALALGALLLIAIVVLWLVLPGVVRNKLIAAADAHGVDLQIGEVELGLHHVVLHDITASVRAMPELHVTAGDMDVQHSWLDVESVAVHHADVQLTGDPSVVSQHASSTLASDAPQITEPLVTITGKLSWKTTGSSAACDEGTVSLNAVAHGDVSMECKALRLTLGSLTFGPWQLMGNHSAARGDSVDVGVGGKSPILAYSRTPEGRVTYDVAIVWQKTTAIGVPDSALSLVSLEDAPTINANVHYEWLARTAKGSFDLATDAAPIAKGHTMPAQLSGKLDGDPQGDLVVSAGTATIGTFSGVLGGTVHADKRRADLSFDSKIISCQDVSAQLTAQAFGPLGQQLGGLVHALGVDQGVKGSMTLHADAALDLMNPGASKVTTKTGGDCTIDLFP